MPRKIAVTNLQASTIDILNVIRQNASAEYQQMVPKVETEKEVCKVGDVLYGYPALANQFLNQLLNRIALVRVRSAVFNNPYKDLKKGYLEYGETIEEVFVNIAKVREFSVEKAEEREFKRTLPDVRAAFHIMNWQVQYPVTIQDEDLRLAFTSLNGVQDMIARIVDSVYTAAEYDEFLLFKYLLIKSISHGVAYPVVISPTNYENNAVNFRAFSNLLTFMSTEYNSAHVHNVSPRSDQYIFMDAMYNAQFDVSVLSAAFNMDKADFMGRLHLIDSWSTFDNERFEEIRKNSDMIDPITDAELEVMKNVKAVIVDAEFFQVYDNLNKFTEKYVASGMYWNYFYNTRKTVSFSPFSNIVAFYAQEAPIEAPASFTAEIDTKSTGENATVLTLNPQNDNAGISGGDVLYSQGQAATEAGVGVQPYGAVLMPPNSAAIKVTATMAGATYESAVNIDSALEQGSTVTFNKVAEPAAAKTRAKR